MAEADPDDRHAVRHGPTQEVLQRRHPGQVVIDAVAGAGDDPPILLRRRLGNDPIDDGIDDDRGRRVGCLEQALHHRAEPVVPLGHVGRHAAGFENANAHREKLRGEWVRPSRHPSISRMQRRPAIPA